MKRRDRIESLIRDWQKRLSLQDWDIRYSEEPPEKDSVANSDAWGLKQVAVIRVHIDAPEIALEREIVHELLHVVLRYIGMVWSSSSARYLPPIVLSEVSALSDDEEEIAIERLVKALTGIRYIGMGETTIYDRTFKEG